MAADKTAKKVDSGVGSIVKLVVSIAAIIVGIVLVTGATSTALADGVFVGSIALVLAVYLWSGVTVGQARIIAAVLVLVSLYAFIRGFGALQLEVVRQLGGITAIVSGVILALPFAKAQFAQRKA